MKILMLTPYLPYPLLSGGQIRTYNLLKKLAKKHQVTLFALIKNHEERKYIPELEKYCTRVEVFKRSSQPFTFHNILQTAFSSFPFLVIRNRVHEVTSAIQRELKKEQYDLIHAETFYMMPHIPKTTTPIILVEQTIEYLGYESYAKKAPSFLKPLLNIDIKKIKKWETFYWNMCDLLITMSIDDKKFIQNSIDSRTQIEVVPNGVDSDWFAQVPKKLADQSTVLSVGTFKWLPNVEAVKFLINKVWPLIREKNKCAQLSIVGNAPTDEIIQYANKDESITVQGRIPDIRDAFAAAHVLIAPVFSGKGTRYKVLEAMASGTPVVATSIAVEGLQVKSGEHVLLGDTAEELAQQTLKLLKDTQLQKRLATKSRNFVKKEYDWKLISEKLDTIYQQIGARHAHASKKN